MGLVEQHQPHGASGAGIALIPPSAPDAAAAQPMSKPWRGFHHALTRRRPPAAATGDSRAGGTRMGGDGAAARPGMAPQPRPGTGMPVLEVRAGGKGMRWMQVAGWDGMRWTQARGEGDGRAGMVGAGVTGAGPGAPPRRQRHVTGSGAANWATVSNRSQDTEQGPGGNGSPQTPVEPTWQHRVPGAIDPVP